MEFNTFEEWMEFSKKNGQQIRNWSEDQLREFNDATIEAINKNPDFAEKYTLYTERLEERLRQKKGVIPLNNEGKEMLLQRRIREIAKQKIKNVTEVSGSGRLDKLRGIEQEATPNKRVTIGSHLTPEERKANQEALRTMRAKKRVISI